MPPSKPKPKPRTYDPTKTHTAVLTQLTHIRSTVTNLTPADLSTGTRLGDWTVRELLAHIGMVLSAVGLSLRTPPPPRADTTALHWPSATAPRSTDIAGFTRRTTDRYADDLPAYLTDVDRRLREVLAEHLPTRPMDTIFGAMTLGDFMVTRALELTVHTDDLNAALPHLDIPHDRQCLATTTRLLADALAEKAPGGATEVRIPPFAVVQCVEGPRHTRGTPPNVVETDPLTWLRLATGRLTWEEALAEAKVSASGERADLGGLLPVMS